MTRMNSGRRYRGTRVSGGGGGGWWEYSWASRRDGPPLTLLERLEAHLAITRDVSAAALGPAGITLSNVRKTLDGINLSGLDAIGTDFRGSTLEKACLARLKGVGANFARCSLVGTDFRGAVLTGASFDGADLSGSDMRDCDLTGADFTFATLVNADLRGAALSPRALDRARARGGMRRPDGDTEPFRASIRSRSGGESSR